MEFEEFLDLKLRRVFAVVDAAERVTACCVRRAPDPERGQVKITPTSYASLRALARALEALKHGR